MIAVCHTCSGLGIKPPDGTTATLARGIPLPLCTQCHGAGHLGPDAFHPGLFRAVWVIGARPFVCRLTLPRQKGGTHVLDLEWLPYPPPEKGPGKLNDEELGEYKRGRDLALQELSQSLGGSYELVEVGPRMPSRSRH